MLTVIRQEAGSAIGLTMGDWQGLKMYHAEMTAVPPTTLWRFAIEA